MFLPFSTKRQFVILGEVLGHFEQFLVGIELDCMGILHIFFGKQKVYVAVNLDQILSIISRLLSVT